MVKKNKQSKTHFSDKVVNYFLLTIWCILLIFGLLTMIQPAWLKELSNPGRKEDAQTFIDFGNMYLFQAGQSDAKQNYENAISNYKEALKIDSLNTVAIANMGVAYMFLNKLEEARDLFEKCIAIDSLTAYFAHAYLGDYYERKGDNTKALEYYLKSAQQHPSPAYSYRKAGLFCIKLQNYDEAIIYLQKSIEIEKSFEYYYKSALINALNTALSVNDTVERNKIKKELSSDDLYPILKKYDQQTFEYSYRMSKNLGYAYMYLGDAYNSKSDFLNAFESYQLSLKYYPDFGKELKDKLFTTELRAKKNSGQVE